MLILHGQTDSTVFYGLLGNQVMNLPSIATLQNHLIYQLDILHCIGIFLFCQLSAANNGFKIKFLDTYILCSLRRFFCTFANFVLHILAFVQSSLICGHIFCLWMKNCMIYNLSKICVVNVVSYCLCFQLSQTEF